MDMLPNSEQQQIIDSVRGYLADQFPLERLRDGAGGDCQVERWAGAAELGLFGMSLTEEAGGAGYGLVEELLLHREAGRVLFSPALLAQALAARLLAEAGEPADALISGEQRVGVLTPIGSAEVGQTLRGDFHLVDAVGARWLLVWNMQGAALLDAAQVSGRDVGSLDETMQVQRVSLKGLASSRYVAGTAIAGRARILLAAQLVGISEAAREMACEYAKLREQFGQPIGAFQAVKHRCADMAVRCEAAWFQSVFAALSTGDEAQGAAALLLASEAANENAAANIQIHGGMGYTAECVAHHLVKRARVLDRLAGGGAALYPVLLDVAQPKESAA